MPDASPTPAVRESCPVTLRGIVPSLNTPFLDNGEVDFPSLGRLIDHLAGAGATGVLCNAVAGEVGSLTGGERRRMLDLIAERAAGRLVVIAGVSSPDLETSVALAAEARAAGVPAINWRAPLDWSPGTVEDGALQIGDAGPELMVLQDLDFQGPGLSIELILRLFEAVPTLQSAKVESAFPGPKISALLERTGGRLHVMGGWPTTSMLDALGRGAHAFMPSHMIPTLVRIARLQEEGRPELAGLLMERLLPLLVFVSQHFDVSLRVGKMLRVAEGVFETEHCRPPATPLDPRMERDARRLVARSLAIAREIEALAD